MGAAIPGPGSTERARARTVALVPRGLCTAIHPRSYRAQCHGGRQPGGSDGWHEAGECADHDRGGDAARPGFYGDDDDPVLRARVDSRGDDSDEDADDAAEDGE